MPGSFSKRVYQSNCYPTSRPSLINASSYRKLSLITLNACISSLLGTSRQDPHSGYRQDAVATTDQLGDPGQVRGQQDTDVVKLGLGRVWLIDNLQSCGGQWQTDWEEGSLLGCTTTVPTGLKGRVRGSSGFCKPQGSPQGGAR